MPKLGIVGQCDVAEYVIDNRARCVAEVDTLAISSRILRPIELLVCFIAVMATMLFALSW